MVMQVIVVYNEGNSGNVVIVVMQVIVVKQVILVM